MPYCTNCGAEKYNPTKFCRACGEKGIDSNTWNSLKVEHDKVKMKNSENESVRDNISTLDAIEKFRREADELARKKQQQNYR